MLQSSIVRQHDNQQIRKLSKQQFLFTGSAATMASQQSALKSSTNQSFATNPMTRQVQNDNMVKASGYQNLNLKLKQPSSDPSKMPKFEGAHKAMTPKYERINALFSKKQFADLKPTKQVPQFKQHMPSRTLDYPDIWKMKSYFPTQKADSIKFNRSIDQEFQIKKQVMQEGMDIRLNHFEEEVRPVRNYSSRPAQLTPSMLQRSVQGAFLQHSQPRRSRAAPATMLVLGNNPRTYYRVMITAWVFTIGILASLMKKEDEPISQQEGRTSQAKMVLQNNPRLYLRVASAAWLFPNGILGSLMKREDETTVPTVQKQSRTSQVKMMIPGANPRTYYTVGGVAWGMVVCLLSSLMKNEETENTYVKPRKFPEVTANDLVRAMTSGEPLKKDEVDEEYTVASDPYKPWKQEMVPEIEAIIKAEEERVRKAKEEDGEDIEMRNPYEIYYSKNKFDIGEYLETVAKKNTGMVADDADNNDIGKEEDDNDEAIIPQPENIDEKDLDENAVEDDEEEAIVPQPENIKEEDLDEDAQNDEDVDNDKQFEDEEEEAEQAEKELAVVSK